MSYQPVGASVIFCEWLSYTVSSGRIRINPRGADDWTVKPRPAKDGGGDCCLWTPRFAATCPFRRHAPYKKRCNQQKSVTKLWWYHTTARGKRNDQGDETQPERHLCGRRVRVGPQKNNNLFGLECQHNTYILKPIIYVQLPSQ